MNQEKIGKFIKELRIEKKLTQQDLALKLNVSDKAISKWENGRCLMDVSLLKPLSEILEVSIVEILSGERIESYNLFDKSNEVVENTLDYSKEEIRKNKIKIIAISIICFVFIIFSFYIIRQSYYWMKYPNFDTNYYIDISDSLNFRKVNKIYKKSLNEDEYLSLGNIKIKNIFTNYILDDHFSNFDIVNDISTVYLKDIDGKNKFVFIRKPDELCHSYNITNRFGDNVYISTDVMRNFYLMNDIDDEFDFMIYASKNGYKMSNFFTTSNQMKFNLAYNNFVVDFTSMKNDYVELIEGDYKGYIRKNESENMIEVFLFKDNMKYNLIFMDEFANYDLIMDLISTVEIR